MQDITRRELNRSLLATGALCLTVQPAISSPLIAGSLKNTGYYRYMIGDIKCTALYDGIWRKPHDQDFIRNASVGETKGALSKGGLTSEHVTIEFSQTLLETADKIILIDPGTGGQWVPTAGSMIKNMAAAGITARDINTILISHFHPDHIFGLMDPDSDLQIFPEAEIILPAAEYDFWTNSSVFAALPKDWHGLAHRIQRTFPRWPNVRRIDSDVEVAPGIRSLATPGHTPGHTSYHVSSGSEELIVAGDVAITPALFVANPGWHVVFDTDPQRAEKTRRSLLQRSIVDDIVIAGYHFGFPNVGKIQNDGAGYLFKPGLG